MGESLTLRVTESAEEDLAEIWFYIAAEASEAVATRFLARLEAQFSGLLRNPLIGPAREEFGAGLRVTFHASYAIYYLPRQGELVIVRVLHGARDTRAIVDQGGFKL